MDRGEAPIEHGPSARPPSPFVDPARVPGRGGRLARVEEELMGNNWLSLPAALLRSSGAFS
jgi:hypothetical protein